LGKQLQTKSLDKAKRIVEKLTDEDFKRLRQCLDKCMAMAVEFCESGKSEYYVKMKEHCEQLMGMFNDFERRIS